MSLPELLEKLRSGQSLYLISFLNEENEDDLRELAIQSPTVPEYGSVLDFIEREQGNITTPWLKFNYILLQTPTEALVKIFRTTSSRFVLKWVIPELTTRNYNFQKPDLEKIIKNAPTEIAGVIEYLKIRNGTLDLRLIGHLIIYCLYFGGNINCLYTLNKQIKNASLTSIDPGTLLTAIFRQRNPLTYLQYIEYLLFLPWFTEVRNLDDLVGIYYNKAQVENDSDTLQFLELYTRTIHEKPEELYAINEDIKERVSEFVPQVSSLTSGDFTISPINLRDDF